MENHSDKIQLHALDGKKGSVISRKHYDLLKNFILDIFQHCDQITLTELMQLAHTQFARTFSGEVAWALLNTKLDLEARGILKICHERNRIQMISLKRKQKVTGLSGKYSWHTDDL
jgi:hypothetical protein